MTRNVAEQLLRYLGGKENISALAHCATSLRLVVNDRSLVDFEEIDKIDLVKGQFEISGQLQIILGTGIVNTVYAEMAALTDIREMSTKEVSQAGVKKQNVVQQAVKTLSDIFVPIIPAIVAGGLLMGVYNLLTAKGLIIDGMSIIEAYPGIEQLASLINTFANAPFVFLPVLLAFSATSRFGGNAYLGAALGMLMVHPDLLNGWGFAGASLNDKIPVWHILGFDIQKVGYQGSVLPVLVSAYILAKTEINLRKVIPSILDNLLTPLLSIFITGIITFSCVGPLTRDIGFFIGDGLNWLYETAGIIGGGVFGFIYAPFVITGMHHSFIAIETQLLSNIATTGGSFIFPVAAMSNIAQGASCLTFSWLSRDKKVTGMGIPAGISAMLGITEPAMFGVNLKNKYPFIAAICASAIGCMYVTAFHVKAQAMGAAGIPGIISIRPESVSFYMIGMLITAGSACGFTYILRKREMRKLRLSQAN
ncbi:sucrose-specific PTS transporter subunit IIBC [Vibrio mangrovi]|uniref:protein-N(pi)-phosphohistidine--sucrose phosphotransferase n=1 Tax=Vibrio mangrovi TaxID=474394 RepID=A0ABU4ICC0_9VIBR|nr:sucrose-specific PTS transporter subunit IIBC [Vibrio mangrovi]MDW6005262.1 sucrose-specific PTS transporter subunit IIBC [Vibrio mangrovi]